MRASCTNREGVAFRPAPALCLGLLALSATILFGVCTAKAEDVVSAIPNSFVEHGASAVELHGLTRVIAPHWKASYGLGLAEQTDLTSAMLRFDHTLAYGTRSDTVSRDHWRHFLGVEYTPAPGFSLIGGFAKSSGKSGGASSGLPSGYERLRFNTGARWRSGDWGIESGFSFIPSGAGRLPGDAGYLPGMGSSSSTYLFSLSFSRRF
jgi:hypothetical protein